MMTSKYFQYKAGVRQGDNLSPFIIFWGDTEYFISWIYMTCGFLGKDLNHPLNDGNIDNFKEH